MPPQSGSSSVSPPIATSRSNGSGAADSDCFDCDNATGDEGRGASCGAGCSSCCDAASSGSAACGCDAKAATHSDGGDCDDSKGTGHRN